MMNALQNGEAVQTLLLNLREAGWSDKEFLQLVNDKGLLRNLLHIVNGLIRIQFPDEGAIDSDASPLVESYPTKAGQPLSEWTKVELVENRKLGLLKIDRERIPDDGSNFLTMDGKKVALHRFIRKMTGKESSKKLLNKGLQPLNINVLYHVLARNGHYGDSSGIFQPRKEGDCIHFLGTLVKINGDLCTPALVAYTRECKKIDDYTCKEYYVPCLFWGLRYYCFDQGTLSGPMAVLK